MLSLAVPVLVYDLTESVTLVGTAAAVANLPSFLGSPLGGVWADRYSKRVVLLLALVAQIILAFLLYQVSIAPDLTVTRLFTLTALNGLSSSINLSAYQALVADIVPTQAVRPAYRLNAIQFNASRAIGPAVAGWVLATWGAPTAFLVNAVAHLPLLATLIVIRPRPVPRAEAKNVLAEILEAARVTWQIPALRASLITISASSAFGMSVQQLGKGLTERVFFVDDAGLGMLVASIGVFAVVTSIALAYVGDRFRGSRLVRGGLVLYGAGLLVVGVASTQTVMYLGLSLLAIGTALASPALTSLVSLYAPEHRQGEILGVFRSLGALGRAIAPIIASLLYWRFGSTLPYVGGALAMLLPFSLSFGLPERDVHGRAGSRGST